MQLEMDTRVPGVVKHHGRYVFQEMVLMPTYMLIVREDDTVVKPISVVVDGVCRTYYDLTEAEKAMPVYAVFTLDDELNVNSYHTLDRNVKKFIDWFNLTELCSWWSPEYMPEVPLTERDIRFAHSKELYNYYNMDKTKLLSYWRSGLETLDELDEKSADLQPKFDLAYWCSLAKRHNDGEISIVKGAGQVFALKGGVFIASHPARELCSYWLRRLNLTDITSLADYNLTVSSYNLLGMTVNEVSLRAGGVCLTREEVLPLLQLDKDRVQLPSDIIFSSETYGFVKDMLEKAQGKYSSGGFTFESSQEASEVLSALLDGVEIDVKKSLQYYATTEKAASFVLDGVDFSGKTVYEPHGGEGFLVRKAFELGAKKVLTSEVYKKFHGALLSEGAELICEDVFSVTKEMLEDVDVLLLNPPFAGGADVKHLNFLLSVIPDGIPIYGIMSGCVKHSQWKLYSDFRAYLKAHNCVPIDIPNGAFKESGTNVSSIAVQILQS